MLTDEELDLVASVRALPDAELVALVARRLGVAPAFCEHCGFGPDGRPHHRGKLAKLTADVQAQIVDAVERWNFPEVAAGNAGVARKTYEKWRRDARDGREPYASLFDEIDLARDRAEVTAVEKLRNPGLDARGGNRAVRHVEFWLERTRRERFGPQLRIEVETAKEQLIDVARQFIDPEAFAEFLQALEDCGQPVPPEARALPA